jgi:hypothetical protein
MYPFGTHFLDRFFHFLLDIGSLVDASPINWTGTQCQRLDRYTNDGSRCHGRQLPSLVNVLHHQFQ